MSLKSAEEWLNPSNELLMEVLGPAPVGPVETKRRIIVAIQADTYRHAAELCDNHQPPDGMSVQSSLAQELEAEANKLEETP